MEQSQEGYNLPTYNMKVVVQETGLNPRTIRTWERRYGLPLPPRATGGHRLYSQYDIDTLQWLIARQAEGLSIRNAAELWRAVEAKGENPLLSVAPANAPVTLLQELIPEIVQSQEQNEAAGALAQLCRQWLTACLRLDRTMADETLTQAFARFSPEVVCTEVLSKALRLIGESWVRGEVSIQQEHFASALAVRRLESLVAAMPPAIRTERVLVCCAPEDQHVFSPLLLTFFILRKGWDVLYLGANVPVDAVKQTVVQTKPKLVVIAAQRLYTAATLLDVARALLPERIGFGGIIFNQIPKLRTIIPGHFLGESLQTAVQNVELLLTQSTSLPTAHSVALLDKRALAHYQARRTLIESHVWGTFFATEKPTHQLMEINLEIAQSIIAALKLGSIELLGNDIAYIEHMLVSYRLSSELLNDYLLAYYQAAKIHLGEPAAAIVDWLAQIVASHTV
jgi:DNA-binding transcriptional MerR regulator